jgi:hypothetical protein
MKRFKVAVLAFALLLGIGACGSSGAGYAVPTAYGVTGYCYYVETPLEVAYLYNAGLCPRTWVAWPMPVAWHNSYYGYYASPRYYQHYAPVSYRTSWVRTQKAYYAPRKSTIKAAQAKAKVAAKKAVTRAKTTVSRPKTNTGVTRPKINLNKGSGGHSTTRRSGKR